jgi:hypothetical protein
VFESSAGDVRGSSATGKRFGLVLQGGVKPTVVEGTNTFLGGEEDVVSDAELPVPGAPQVQAN